MMNLAQIGTPASPEYATVHVVFELSKARWKLGVMLPGSRKLSCFSIAGGDLTALAARLTTMRAAAARFGGPAQILSCYEAGYDGHWLHRWLTEQGVISYVVDPSSIEVNRRARQAKTDGIDVARLMRAFLAFLRGEPRVCSMLRVPTLEQEDRKRLNRERDRLLKERIQHTNRITGLLHGQGIRDANPLARNFLANLDQLRTGDGRQLPPRLKAEIVREHERLCLVTKHLQQLEATTRAELRNPAPQSPAAKINQLMDLKSIGLVGGQGLFNEAFYRSFVNRREVGSYFGMAGTPFNSGESSREQGISKAGNWRARKLAIELAWLWLRHQPQSELSQWFHKRVGDQKGRIRRITIVAVARKLMIALWRYLSLGVVPTGAVARTSS